MSLAVSLLKPTPNGDLEVVEPDGVGADLAGFESWRTELYGATAARELGLVLLPQLAQADLQCTSREELQTLRSECLTILENLERFSKPAEDVKRRVGNILRAVERALNESWGVIIW